MANIQGNVPEWASVRPAGGERHLPVYLLLDCSTSMNGDAIFAVQRGLEQFQAEVAGDPFARDVVRVGLITFAGDAELVTGGLIPIAQFAPPMLRADGVTRLDLAFDRLLESMDRHVVKAVRGGQKGDFKPAVFILTDGRPTDEEGYETDRLWPAARDAVIHRPRGQIRPSAVVAVGCGPDVDDDTLKAISTGAAFRIGASEAAFVTLFQYLSQTITSSVQPGGNAEDPFANLEPAEPGDLIVRVP